MPNLLEGGVKKVTPRVCKAVFENTRIKPLANSYAYLVMRVELIVRKLNARNPHIVSNFIRLARHLVIDECLFNGIRTIGCIRIDFGVGIIASFFYTGFCIR